MAADVKIDVKVDDKGSLNQVGKSAQSARRQIGGVAKTASAGGKQFSKMSQGISGGLVPAYAQLAATLFAVDALFRALKSAAQLRVQEQGMMAFAASTGTAMKGVARDLQAASGGLLSFKDAASSAAIGLAAGLNAGQLEQISTAAKNASIALGRNFADSYDRVLKGIVKGEPELLDELGIILRLDTATREYAQSMGLNQDKLTAWQRSQAVFNNVIDQATEKYATMGEGIPVSQIEKLGTKLEDTGDKIMKALNPVAEFLAGVLTGSVQAVIAVIMVFISSVVSKMIPKLGDLRNSMSATATSIKTDFGNIGSTFTGGKADMKKAWADSKGGAATKARTVSSARAIEKGEGSKTLGALKAGEDLNKGQKAALNRMLKNAERQYKKHGEIVSGYLKGENIKRVRHLKRSMKLQENPLFRFGMKAKAVAKGVTTTFKVGFKTIGAVGKLTFKGLSLAAKTAGMAMNAAMKGAGLIGVALMIWDIFKALKDNMDKILVFIGNTLKSLGETIAGWAAKLQNTFPRLAAVLNKLSEGAISKGTELVDKGEAEKARLTEVRATKARAAAYEELSTNMAKARDEMADMAAMKKDDMTAGQEAKWAANFTSTAGSKMQGDVAAIAGMFDSRSKATDAQKKTAVGDIIANLNAMASGSGNDEYAIMAMGLEILSARGLVTKKVLQDLGDELKVTNGKAGAAGKSFTELGNLNEAYSRSVSELNKGLGNTRWDQVGKSVTGMVNNMTILAEKEKGLLKLDEEALALAKKLYGEEAAGLMNRQQFLDRLKIDQAAYNKLILAEFELKTKGNALKLQTLEASRYKGMAGKMIQRELTIKKNLLAVEQARDALRQAERVYAESKPEDKDAAARGVALAIQEVAIAQKSHDVHKQTTTVMGQLQSNLQVGFENMFADLIKGTKSLKEAFRDLFANTMMWLAQVLAKMAAAKILGSFFPGMGSLMGRDGGIMNPPGYRSFSSGGVASGSKAGYPVTLHGTEAVVPLPNGKSIPVDMRGSAAPAANITVNVSGAGGQQQTTSAGAGEKERKLGQMVAAAVQAEILEQQRPGNLLSPYGDGDI